jgi:hypothetical protein
MSCKLFDGSAETSTLVSQEPQLTTAGWLDGQDDVKQACSAPEPNRRMVGDRHRNLTKAVLARVAIGDPDNVGRSDR